jgi:RHS repeat-associated protein
VDTLGVTNVYEYGADARLARVKRAGAVLAQFQFDAAGRTTNFVGPEGLTIAATFDNLDRLLTLTLPGESAYSLAYVTNDLRVSRATDRSGRRTDFSYSIVGALSSVRAPDLSLVRFEHNAEGNLLALLDSEIRKTRFAYDSRNRPIGKTYPDGTSNRVDWTVQSLVSNVTSPRGVASVYAYNSAGLLTNVTYSGTTNTPAIRMAYDSFNRPTNTVDGWSTNRFTYDILGRVTQAREIQGVFTQTFDYVFDQGGRLTNVAWKAGTNATLSTRYQYDNLNRITNLVSDAGSFGYTYASNGLLVKTLRYPNGETANYTCDGLRRMTNLLYKTSGGTANGQWSYTYDSRDFVTRRLDPATNTYAFRYDEAGRLVEATGAKNGTNVTGYPFRYAYDRAGNRTYQVEGSRQRRLTYNVNNQLLAAARSNEASVAGYVNEAGTGTVVEIKSDSMAAWQRVGLRYVSYTQAWFEAYGVTVTNAGTNTILVRATDKSGNASTQTVKVVNATTNVPFAYDLDGNRTNGLGTTLEWDAENRPVRFAYGTAGETRLRYDGLGRLREIAEYGTNAVPTNVVRYTWNGWLPWAELDASNRTQRTFTWGLDLSGTVGAAGGIGGLVGMRGYTGSGTNYCVRTDGMGNITEVRQSNTVVVATYAYAPFGAVLTNTGSYVQPFRFQTKLAHARSGLGYWGYRWYDTRTGQWITRDPLAEAGGINLYAYCGANPVNGSDPFGLADELDARVDAMEKTHTNDPRLAGELGPTLREGLGEMGGVALSTGATMIPSRALTGLLARLGRAMSIGKWFSRCRAAKGIRTFADKTVAREAFSGATGDAANRFFRGATGKSTGFKAIELPTGGQRFEFFSPARNSGYGKRYIQEIDRTGYVVREFKETIGPGGVIETKWVHGGPVQ